MAAAKREFAARMEERAAQGIEPAIALRGIGLTRKLDGEGWALKVNVLTPNDQLLLYRENVLPDVPALIEVVGNVETLELPEDGPL